MLILGVSTSTQQAGCALGGHEGVLALVQSAKGRRHAENLAPAIGTVRDQADVDLSDIGCVAVDVGPGLFTGLRVGIATAKAMAHALRVPMVGVSSLDLVAFPVRWTSRLIVAVLDARRGEVFTASYRQVPGGLQRVAESRVCTPVDLATELMATREEVLLVGDGAWRHSADFEVSAQIELADKGLQYPSAGALVQLAHARAMREEFVPHWELAPLYLRAPDASIAWDDRGTPAASGSVAT